MLSHEMTL